MQYGVCGGLPMNVSAADARYDFAEWTVASLLKPRETDEAFRAGLKEAHAARLPYPVVNCFIPGDLKITGPEVNTEALKQYVTTTFQRAEQAKVEVIVFGSGGARRVPDGFDPATARRQIVTFCTMFAPLAQRHGVTVVAEPLNRQECNIMNTVAECAALVKEVAHPAFRLLVDAYHLMRDGDSYADIVTHGALLAHVHLATVPKRLAPGAEPCDLAPFFAALKKAGYNGRVSIEGSIPNPASELPVALEMMKRLESKA